MSYVTYKTSLSLSLFLSLYYRDTHPTNNGSSAANAAGMAHI